MQNNQGVENQQNDITKCEQELLNRREELMKSKQFSTYKKSNNQESKGIVKYKSQIVDSDEEDQNNDKNAQNLNMQSISITECDQKQYYNIEKETNFDNLKPLDFEEVLRQSQYNFNLHKKDKSINNSQFNTVIITQVDSEDDEQSNEKEISDQLALEIEAITNQENEVNADNRIMMSVIQSKLTKQIQKQQKMQQSLNNQSNQLNDLFKSKIVFINKTPVIIREDEKYIRKIRKIQNYFRFVKPYKKLKKQHRYRVNIINELIQTERNYVNDLNSIREHIQIPLLSLIDCKDDVKFMFNLDSICNFNIEFLKILLSKEQNVKEQPYAKIMEEIFFILPGFKFYFDYCKVFQTSKKMRDHYSNTNQVYKNFFIDFLEKQPNFFNNLDIESYLIKPVQRLPKYILLFKDLLKHTNKDHPDYKNIEQCLKLFQQINDKNNSQIKSYLEQLKFIELQNQLKQQIIIIEPNREFCFEEFCTIYTDKTINNIMLYAFNNLLLFVQKKENEQYIYSFHLKLTYQSYVKNKENTDYFEHFFEVVNKTESIIIINHDNESKIQLIDKIQDIIQQLKQKQINMQNLRKSASITTEIVDYQQEQKQQNNDYEIKVIIIGTEIRNIKYNPYTVYVVQIYIQEYQTKIFVRYSQIVSLQSIVNKYDPNLKVPFLSTLNWFHSIDSKVIEERKLLIEKFLSSVLNSFKFQNQIEYQIQILDLLNLSQDFIQIHYKQNQTQYIKFGEEDMMKMLLQSQYSSDIKPNLLQSMIMKRKSTNIIQAAKISTQKFKTIQEDNSIVIGQDATKQPYFIDVYLMDDRIITVGFKKQTLTLFIKNEVAKFVGLKQWLDFRLFIVDQNKDQRVIDDDEKISSILDAHTYQNTGLINTFKKLFNNQQKFQFIFRKHFYLQWKQEEADFNQDQQRLNYIIYEIMWDIKNQKFQSYNFNEYCLIIALLFYSTNITQNQISSLIYKVVPKNYLKSKKEEVWLKEIVNNINTLQLLLKQIQKEDQQTQIKKNQQCYSTSIQGIAQSMIMNFFKTNSLFGMQQFFVECSKQTIQLIQNKFKVQINNNIYIGLNYNGFHILNSENKELINTFQYNKLSEMKACTKEFSCIISSAKLSFNTQFSFEIKLLILEYKQLQEFTQQLMYGVN